MRKIKKSTNKKVDITISSKRNIIIFIAIGIFILVISALIFVESKNGKMVIINDTDLKLNYAEAVFSDAEDFISERWKLEDLNSGDSSSLNIGKINLLGREANLRIKFEFEDYELEDELFVDAGYFNEDFDGKITIEFLQEEEDIVKLRVKARNGLLSSRLTQCNEVHNVNYKDSEPYIEE